ncbi:aminomethyl-transferring glycine dehydrogenase subunit GcvPB [Hydrogenibacillus schlegelii]|uniref:aminomethyl-transferring glycine dehydrogenase subunit GcvPB n=1 Tax=Hydrogenibacillus schlegelii TaxID=1484 RepID=UPI0009E6A175|nr:aminomethyl-transferring glycine dehydrogenase subunit GcvPB [Hydrogenibacillus schlegelii]
MQAAGAAEGGRPAGAAPALFGPREVPLLFERSQPGKRAADLPPLDVPPADPVALYGEALVRTTPPLLPEVSEPELVRHYTALSRRNYGVDTGFYPLGSCTMKYNPKINEDLARLDGFVRIHPLAPVETVQGALELLHRLEAALREITGMDAVSLLPAAGSHGELVGLKIIAAYHRARGERRRKVLVPDSAHGTNPASAAMAGFEAVSVPSDARGLVDLDAYRAALGPDVAAVMLTNPNTLGLFETDILAIVEAAHAAGALVYYDGANLNAILGKSRPGDMGFDVVHVNVHKTFSTPHGGGGPGAGPVGVKAHLEPYLPIPRVVAEKRPDGSVFYRLSEDHPHSIGRVRGFAGSFGVLVRAYAYIRALGAEGLRQVAEDAVLAANYVLSRLKDVYDVPYGGLVKHEFVLSGRRQKARGVRTLDIAKRLMDYGFHPPTIYFPLIVEEALMIEPTETESKETLDAFIAAMRAIAEEAERDPALVRSAPHTTPVGRLDEAKAARQPVLVWRPDRS